MSRIDQRASIATPLGKMTLRIHGGRIIALDFDDRDANENRIDDEPGELGMVVRRTLDAYFAGERVLFDFPVAPAGTPFQHDVWAALQRIPYGATRSYAQIAQEVGRPLAVRAVGAANSRNPIAILIPCHRVIGGNGTLTGYAGGLDRKRALLALEAPQPFASSTAGAALQNV
ncbi:MAG TPA: methylated-DNA--[protein]-cysteine S-methyltransferase [Casimicrobiaceae bacterium]|nr:methylated-DNA--[protein]-cysteine S-methyltransferase [Casimicrobiaceae bacterium]